jgi:hypothetical protein
MLSHGYTTGPPGSSVFSTYAQACCVLFVLLQLEWELSGPTVAGEGEVKILGRLARPRHADSVDPSDTHSESPSREVSSTDIPSYKESFMFTREWVVFTEHNNE